MYLSIPDSNSVFAVFSTLSASLAKLKLSLYIEEKILFEKAVHF